MWSLTVDCCVWWQLVKLQPAKVLVPLVSKITYMVVQKKADTRHTRWVSAFLDHHVCRV